MFRRCEHLKSCSFLRVPGLKRLKYAVRLKDIRYVYRFVKEPDINIHKPGFPKYFVTNRQDFDSIELIETIQATFYVLLENPLFHEILERTHGLKPIPIGSG